MTRWLALVLILLLVIGCAPWVRPPEEKGLRYAGPVEIGISPGGFLPGTQIQYLGKGEDGALVVIQGQQAQRKIGDSLNWQGDLATGAAADLNLRVLLIAEEELHLLGALNLIIAEAEPRPAAIDESAPVRFKLPVEYAIKTGETIPGTTISYLGKAVDGAHLGNIEGYPYREVGDSIVWRGQLRDRIWLELNLRTVLFSDNALNVAGTAELWITP